MTELFACHNIVGRTINEWEVIEQLPKADSRKGETSGYSPSAGASSSSLTRVSISPDFSPVLVLTKKYFMKTFGAAALGVPCLLS